MGVAKRYLPWSQEWHGQRFPGFIWTEIPTKTTEEVYVDLLAGPQVEIHKFLDFRFWTFILIFHLLVNKGSYKSIHMLMCLGDAEPMILDALPRERVEKHWCYSLVAGVLHGIHFCKPGGNARSLMKTSWKTTSWLSS